MHEDAPGDGLDVFAVGRELVGAGRRAVATMEAWSDAGMPPVNGPDPLVLHRLKLAVLFGFRATLPEIVLHLGEALGVTGEDDEDLVGLVGASIDHMPLHVLGEAARAKAGSTGFFSHDWISGIIRDSLVPGAEPDPALVAAMGEWAPALAPGHRRELVWWVRAQLCRARSVNTPPREEELAADGDDAHAVELEQAAVVLEGDLLAEYVVAAMDRIWSVLAELPAPDPARPPTGPMARVVEALADVRPADRVGPVEALRRAAMAVPWVSLVSAGELKRDLEAVGVEVYAEYLMEWMAAETAAGCAIVALSHGAAAGQGAVVIGRGPDGDVTVEGCARTLREGLQGILGDGGALSDRPMRPNIAILAAVMPPGVWFGYEDEDDDEEGGADTGAATDADGPAA